MAGVSARQEGLVIERLVVSLAAGLGLMEHCSFISTFRHASHVELVLDCIIKQLLLRLYAKYTGALVPKGLPNAVNHGLVRTGHRESLISAMAAPSPLNSLKITLSRRAIRQQREALAQGKLRDGRPGALPVSSGLGNVHEIMLVTSYHAVPYADAVKMIVSQLYD